MVQLNKMPKHLKWYKDSKRMLVYRNKQRLINYSYGNFHINKQKHHWNDDDDYLVMLHDQPDRELAKYLETSVESIAVRRWRLKKLCNNIQLKN
jgi:hypothetical protein